MANTKVPGTIYPSIPHPGQPSGVGSFEPGHPYAISSPFNGHATLADDLVSYWKLDEVSGNRADSVGSNTLTDNNTVGSAAGMSGLAASFVAANTESLSFSGAITTWTADNSVVFWGYTNDTTIYRLFSTVGLPVDMNHSGTTVTASWRAGSIQRTATTSNAAWHLYAMVQEGTDYSLSVDGGAFSTVSGAANIGGSDVLKIGVYADGSTHPLNGRIDEFGIWSRALTIDEIVSLYNAGAGLFY
jgi:hypothetical protein